MFKFFYFLQSSWVAVLVVAVVIAVIVVVGVCSLIYCAMEMQRNYGKEACVKMLVVFSSHVVRVSFALIPLSGWEFPCLWLSENVRMQTECEYSHYTLHCNSTSAGYSRIQETATLISKISCTLHWLALRASKIYFFN